MLVEHGVQTPHFVLVPLLRVGLWLAGVSREVVGLPLHGAYAGVLEEEPVLSREKCNG